MREYGHSRDPQIPPRSYVTKRIPQRILRYRGYSLLSSPPWKLPARSDRLPSSRHLGCQPYRRDAVRVSFAMAVSESCASIPGTDRMRFSLGSRWGAVVRQCTHPRQDLEWRVYLAKSLVLASPPSCIFNKKHVQSIMRLGSPRGPCITRRDLKSPYRAHLPDTASSSFRQQPEVSRMMIPKIRLTLRGDPVPNSASHRTGAPSWRGCPALRRVASAR